jgi:hypothetical protein
MGGTQRDGRLLNRVNGGQGKGPNMHIRGFGTTATAAFLALSGFIPYASAGETNGTDVVVQLRLAGDIEAVPPIRSCLAKKLSQMPDVKVATASDAGARFIVDIVAAKKAISCSRRNTPSVMIEAKRTDDLSACAPLITVGFRKFGAEK